MVPYQLDRYLLRSFSAVYIFLWFRLLFGFAHDHPIGVMLRSDATTLPSVVTIVVVLQSLISVYKVMQQPCSHSQQVPDKGITLAMTLVK